MREKTRANGGGIDLPLQDYVLRLHYDNGEDIDEAGDDGGDGSGDEGCYDDDEEFPDRRRQAQRAAARTHDGCTKGMQQKAAATTTTTTSVVRGSIPAPVVTLPPTRGPTPSPRGTAGGNSTSPPAFAPRTSARTRRAATEPSDDLGDTRTQEEDQWHPPGCGTSRGRKKNAADDITGGDRVPHPEEREKRPGDVTPARGTDGGGQHHRPQFPGGGDDKEKEGEESPDHRGVVVGRRSRGSGGSVVVVGRGMESGGPQKRTKEGRAADSRTGGAWKRNGKKKKAPRQR
ncbi:translation initiation factor IF-2-like [Colletes gigas]|uniref:translation initiation factor IF-2-like n=1 Tax=Colletes gigas TaxID=935657 RepID=UPI001C9BA348|nr:translation initiation factor IF-2-like [Colletes gigas]